jgi:hypothetical protein
MDKVMDFIEGVVIPGVPPAMSLVNVACNEVKIAVNKLNSRPRKWVGNACTVIRMAITLAIRLSLVP